MIKSVYGYSMISMSSGYALSRQDQIGESAGCHASCCTLTVIDAQPRECPYVGTPQPHVHDDEGHATVMINGHRQDKSRHGNDGCCVK